MPKSLVIYVLLFGSTLAIGQNLNITFQGQGDSTQIDSVKALNLKTNHSITLPGDETLVLSVNTGIWTRPDLTNTGLVYPNPCTGKATLTTSFQRSQTVFLQIVNLDGQVLVRTQVLAKPGENEFALSFARIGTFSVSLKTESGIANYQIICTNTSESDNSIKYLGAVSTSQNRPNNPAPFGLKNSQTGFTLAFSAGDIILYRCFSNRYKTVFTDSPTYSKSYLVEFYPCIDNDGKDYSVVKFGTQTWMAENHAYLPSVSPSSSGSDISPYNYVFGYEGSNVSEAKRTAYYSTYGVLYNWEAAKRACPSGWHLPTDAEWTGLADYLISKGYGYGGSGSDIGKSMASTSGWIVYSTAGTVGNNQATNNSSGFTALPGGERTDYGGFIDLSRRATFWTSSENNSTAGKRILSYGSDGLFRHYSYYKNYGYYVRCLLNQVGKSGEITHSLF